LIEVDLAMGIIFILTGLLFAPPLPPGCLRGPDVPVWDSWCSSFDVNIDYRVDLCDVAEIQARWECDGQYDVVRPVQNWDDCGK